MMLDPSIAGWISIILLCFESFCGSRGCVRNSMSGTARGHRASVELARWGTASIVGDNDKK